MLVTGVFDQSAPPVGQFKARTFIDGLQTNIELSVILPTFNERDNIGEVFARLDTVLKDVRWEAIVIDDDSPDGTAELVRVYADRDPRIRLIHRVGRRGLSSACIEGMHAACAPAVAVMDADLQHDEGALPEMFDRLHNEHLDVVVGTRHRAGGSMGDFSTTRVMLSQFGRTLSRSISDHGISDPMSGFFIVRRSFFLEVADHLDGRGFKILLDMVATSTRKVTVGEVGYRFRTRQHGESKLGACALISYLLMVMKRLFAISPAMRMLSFASVGAMGASIQIGLTLLLSRVCHMQFAMAEAISIAAAMVVNYGLNNRVTFHDRSLAGRSAIKGLLAYCNASALGACINAALSIALLHLGAPWASASILGIIAGASCNYWMSGLIVWKPRTLQSKGALRVLANNSAPN
jgi:dolichol-phosphate mannosyltransferase